MGDTKNLISPLARLRLAELGPAVRALLAAREAYVASLLSNPTLDALTGARRLLAAAQKLSPRESKRGALNKVLDAFQEARLLTQYPGAVSLLESPGVQLGQWEDSVLPWGKRGKHLGNAFEGASALSLLSAYVEEVEAQTLALPIPARARAHLEELLGLLGATAYMLGYRHSVARDFRSVLRRGMEDSISFSPHEVLERTGKRLLATERRLHERTGHQLDRASLAQDALQDEQAVFRMLAQHVSDEEQRLRGEKREKRSQSLVRRLSTEYAAEKKARLTREWLGHFERRATPGRERSTRALLAWVQAGLEPLHPVAKLSRFIQRRLEMTTPEEQSDELIRALRLLHRALQERLALVGKLLDAPL